MEWPSDVPREIRLLSATHHAAEVVMANRHALIEVDKRRQNVRQAARVVEDLENRDRVTLMTGSFMIKLPQKEVKEILKKDLLALDIESNRLQSQLKEDVNLLHELEMRDPIRGFNLQALSRPEMAAVAQVLGKDI